MRLSGALVAATGFGLTLAIGLALLVAGGAPTSWLTVQAGAGIVALGLFLPAVRRVLPRLATALVLGTMLALLATLLLDDGLDGVHRWLSIGPLRLHIGMLLLPAVLTVHAVGTRRGSGLVLISCVPTLARQPDLGMAIGVMLALLPAALIRREWQDWFPLVAAVGALVVSAAIGDQLQPEAMVEHVLTDSWRWAAWTGPLALLGALILPAALLFRACVNPAPMLPAYTLVSLWIGLLLASLIGHYPVPLLGYGASAVVGFGLALALALAAPVREAEQ